MSFQKNFIIDLNGIFGLFFEFINKFISNQKSITVLITKDCPNIFYFLFQKFISWTSLKSSCSNDFTCTSFPEFLLQVSFSSDRDWYESFFYILSYLKIDCYELVKHLKMGFFHLFFFQMWISYSRENYLRYLKWTLWSLSYKTDTTINKASPET